jgi:hypothetical protein
MNVRKIAAYLSLLVVVLYIITGYGITKNLVIEQLTFGLLTKSLSFKLHEWLIYPLIWTLLWHIYLSSGAHGWLKGKFM